MTEKTRSVRGESDAMVREYDYGDEELLVVDFGRAGAEEGAVDVVDGTAIVVLDDEQYEFDVPGKVSRGIMNNGILTVEVER